MANPNPYDDAIPAANRPAPGQAAPTPANGNPYDEMIPGQPAPAQAIRAVQGVKPDDAATAIKVAPKANLPPQAIMHDPGQVKGMVAADSATAISNANPAMGRWATGNPAHVAASQDNFDFLDALSHTFDIANKLIFTQPGEAVRPYLGGWQEFERQFGSQIEQVLKPTPPSREEQEAVSPAGVQLQDWLAKNIPGMASLQSGIASTFARGWYGLGVPLTPISGTTTALIGNPLEKAFGIRREVVGNILSLLIPFGMKAKGVPEVAGEAHPLKTQADQNLATIDALHAAISANPLKEKSPETMEAFIKQVTDGTPSAAMRINGSTVLDAYNTAGYLPFKGDGMLGWVPNLGEKLASAALTGGDIEVPTYGYLANASEEGHAALREGISMGDMPSVKEASELKPVAETPTEAKPELTPEEKARAEEVAPQIDLALKAAKERSYIDALFKKAKDANMSEGQFNLYGKKIEAAVSGMREKMLDLVRKQVEREHKEDWQTRLKELFPNFQADIRQQPDFAARHFLATGENIDGRTLTPVKLDRADAARLTPDIIENLPKDIFGANGARADDLAKVYGFNNGEAMLRAIDHLERIRKVGQAVTGEKIPIAEHADYVAYRQANDAVKGELGNHLTPASIELQARAAVQIPEVTSLLNEELKRLADMAGLPIHKENIAAIAREALGSMTLDDADKLGRMETLVGRNARDAEKFLLKGDVEAAFTSKMRQLVNRHMLEEARKFQDERERFTKSINRWSTEQTLPGMSQDYFNRIHEILQMIGLKTAMRPEKLARELGAQPLGQWIADRQAEGDAIVESRAWPDTLNPKVGTVKEFRDLHDMLRSIAQSGRNASTVLTHETRMDLASAITEVKDQLDDFANKHKLEDLVDRSESWKAQWRESMSWLRRAGAAVKSMEFIVDKFDGERGIHGILNRVLMRPLQDAMNVKSAELRRFAMHFKEFNEKASKEFKEAFKSDVEVPLEFKDRHGESIRPIQTKRQLLQAALYYGSQSGRAKLLEGFGWGAKEEGVLVSAFQRYFGDEDHAWLEHAWEWGEKSWEKIEPFTRKMAGIPIDKVDAQPFTLGNKTLSGGYSPISYDEQLLQVSGKKPAKGNKDLYAPNYASTATPRGYTKGRTGYVGPLSLNPNVMYSAYMQAIHDYSTREAITSANNFLSHPDVTAAITKAFGGEYSTALKSWLRRQANSMNTNLDELGWINTASNVAVHAVTTANLAYHVSTVAIHGTTAAAKSFQDLGKVGWSRALKLYIDDPKAFTQFGLDKSEFLRDRRVDREDTQSAQYDSFVNSRGNIEKFGQKLEDIGFTTLRMSDAASAYFQWRGAYEEYMADPKYQGDAKQDEDAVFYADKAVRRAHGSGRGIDLPFILDQKSPFVRSIVPFMTSRMNSLNRILDSGNWRQAVAHTLTTVGVSTAVYSLLHQNNDPWYDQLEDNAIVEASGYIPILGDVMYTAYHNTKVQITLLDDALQSITDEAVSMGKFLEGKGLGKSQVVGNTLRMAGLFTKGITAALAKPAEYWTERATGYRYNPGLWKSVIYTLFGPPPLTPEEKEAHRQ